MTGPATEGDIDRLELLERIATYNATPAASDSDLDRITRLHPNPSGHDRADLADLDSWRGGVVWGGRGGHTDVRPQSMDAGFSYQSADSPPDGSSIGSWAFTTTGVANAVTWLPYEGTGSASELDLAGDGEGLTAFEWRRWVKADAGATLRAYAYCIDAVGNSGSVGLRSHCYWRNQFPVVTQQLEPGDTVIHVDDASQYNIYNVQWYTRMIAIHDPTVASYTADEMGWHGGIDCEFGSHDPDFGYGDGLHVADKDETANTLTLASGWWGPTLPVGTMLRHAYVNNAYLIDQLNSPGNSYLSEPDGEWLLIGGLVHLPRTGRGIREWRTRFDQAGFTYLTTLEVHPSDATLDWTAYPADPPTALAGEAGSTAGDIDLSWEAPLYTGRTPITGYTITSRPLGGTTWTEVSIGVGESYTLSVTDESHEVAIATLNAAGRSSWSPVVVTDIVHPSGTVITAPTPAEVIANPVTLSGTALDDVGLASVELWIRNTVTDLWLQSDGTFGAAGDGFVIAPVDTPGATSSTWSWTIPTGLPFGSYYMVARSIDTAGQREVAANVVYFDVGPTVTIAAPPDGAEVETGVITFSGTADAEGGTIDVVRLSIINEDNDLYWDGTQWTATWSWFAVTGTDAWTTDLDLPPATNFRYSVHAWANGGHLGPPARGELSVIAPVFSFPHRMQAVDATRFGIMQLFAEAGAEDGWLAGTDEQDRAVVEVVSGDYLEFEFTTPAPADVKFWGRSFSPNPARFDRDSFLSELNGSVVRSWTGFGADWAETQIPVNPEVTGAITLPAGDHVFRLYLREDGSQVDWVEIREEP